MAVEIRLAESGCETALQQVEGFDLSVFRVDPPTYEEILAVRAERQQLVTDFLATATAELLLGRPVGQYDERALDLRRAGW